MEISKTCYPQKCPRKLVQAQFCSFSLSPKNDWAPHLLRRIWKTPMPEQYISQAKALRHSLCLALWGSAAWSWGCWRSRWSHPRHPGMRPAFSPRCTVRGPPRSSERCRSTHGPERSAVCRWSCQRQKVWCCCRGSPWAVVPIGSSRGPGRHHQPPAHWRKLLWDRDKNDQLCATDLQLNDTVKLGDSLLRVWTIQGSILLKFLTNGVC